MLKKVAYERKYGATRPDRRASQLAKAGVFGSSSIAVIFRS